MNKNKKSMNIIKKKISKTQLEIKNELISNSFHPVYAHILALRGVKTTDEAKYNFKLVPPSKLKGINKLSQELADAILAQKKVCIVADYDCDGATSCAIAYEGLKQLGLEQLTFFVPNRFKHGYGISKPVIDDLIEVHGKPDVIVTVDNGIAAHDGINYGNSLGIQLLVTDHHLPIKNKENPDCIIVNPNQEGDQSGLNNMAGCGVIFYCLMETLERLKEKDPKYKDVNLLNLIDLVSLGTVADVVKLDQNNRKLIKYGLNLLHSNKVRNGIKALFTIAKKDFRVANSRDYGFSIAPRINAAGRLEDMGIGIKCLLEKDFNQAKTMAEGLDNWNIKRKEIESLMKEEAFNIIEEENQKGVSRVIYNDQYHEGVIGIVAGRIKELYNCPVIVFSPTEEEEYIKGSGRSIPEVHLRDAIDLVYKEDSTIFKGFGGHAMAAGLTIRKDRLNDFKEMFEKSVLTFIPKPLEKEIEYDLDLPYTEINVDLAKKLENEIWGQGFIEPIFRSILTVDDVKFLSKDGVETHTKLILNGIEAIQFFTTEPIQVGDRVEVLYRLNVSRFQEEKVSLLIIYKEVI